MSTRIHIVGERSYHVKADFDRVEKAIQETPKKGFFPAESTVGGRVLIFPRHIVSVEAVDIDPIAVATPR